MRRTLIVSSCVLMFSIVGAAAQGAEDKAAPAATMPAEFRLPQTQEYQRVLRQYLSTLTEKDFEHGVTAKLAVPPVNPDLEHQYRDYIFSMLQSPHVGGKRGTGAVNAPSRNFLLTTIEGPKAIIVPPVWAESMGSFVQWDSPGNPYRDNKALKMRAFVTAAVKLMMIDDHLDKNPAAGLARSDWNCYHVIAAAAPYPVFKNEVPAEVRSAFEAGVKRLARKLIAVGPKGESCDFEMGVPVALWYAANATGDAALMEEAQAYAKKLCTDPRVFHPAGYWVERGGLDVGFGGMANFWSVWLALASDWPFVKETVGKAYRLKSHLALPDPDGKLAGPTAFNNRLGSPSSEDQWDWDNAREHAAAMVTDEAVIWAKLPTAEALAAGVKTRTNVFNDHLFGLKNAPYRLPDGKRSGRYLENSELRGVPWRWSIFPNGFNYPVEVIPGYEFYRPGAYARLIDLQNKKSPMLQSPYLRGETFVRNFGDAFVIARRKNFAAILHVGPVGESRPDDGYAQYNGPLGFGGGQLAAFWTPESGSAILNRRGGIAIQGENTKNFDVLDQWRNWPLHAVTGANTDGKIFTSARIIKPAVTNEVKADSADVKVAGTIPAQFPGQEGGLTGELAYSRTFHVDDNGVRVETSVSGDGKDKIAELYETIPVFHRDGKLQPKATPAVIEFQSGDGTWSPAGDAWAEQVKAVRVTRFTGSVLVTFDTPRRVKLSPAEWKDGFLSRAVCRNVLVDLLDNKDQAGSVKDAKKVAYRVEAGAK